MHALLLSTVSSLAFFCIAYIELIRLLLLLPRRIQKALIAVFTH